MYSRRVNDTTSSVWDGDNGVPEGSCCGSGGVCPGHLPGWAVTFCWPEIFPCGFGSMPSAGVRCCGASSRVVSICPDFPCTAAAGESARCKASPCSQGNCWQLFVSRVEKQPWGFSPWGGIRHCTCVFPTYKNMIFYGVSCLAAQGVFEGVWWSWRKSLAFPSPEELGG